MVFWSRSRLLRLRSLTNHHHHSSFTNQQHIRFTDTKVLDRNPTGAQPYGFVRFFAAPVLANAPKPQAKEDTALRLNEKITAAFVRLVEDDRHGVVSRHEALERARKLKLDLVEVDRTAKPPVCKIMDYHREKYKRQVTEKEKAKSKAEGVLRKASPKEIRFTDKTEKKDLQTKADTVKRLMEKGYRVKCMAVGKEDQDLGGMLSRLSALIEDVAVVESGPMVEKKQAYVIVRHMKFGLTKKGSGKKTSTSSTSPAAAPSSKPNQGPLDIEENLNESDTQSESEDDIDPGEMDTPFTSSAEWQHGDTGEKKMTGSILDGNVDFEKVFSFGESKGTASNFNTRKMVDEKDGISPLEEAHTNSVSPSFAQVNRGQGATNRVSQGPAQVSDNRYSRQGATNMAPQGPAQVGENRYFGRGATNTVPQGPTQVGDNRYSGRSATNTVPQGPAHVGDNRYFGRSATNMAPQGPAQVGENRYFGRGATNTVPQGPTQVGDNRYSGRSATSTVPQGPAHVGDNRYFGRSATNTIPGGPAHVGDNRYSGPGATNTVPQGPGQVGDNRYSGRSEANTVPQGPAEGGDNRYSGRGEVRGRFHHINSTEGLADVTKLSEFSPVRFRNFRQPPTDGPLKQEPLHPNATETKCSSFGIFSASKNHSPGEQSVATEASRVRGSSKVEDDQREETRKWGQFGR